MKEKTTNLSIKRWSKDDRPREKLTNHGIETLSNAELIALLIRSGTRNESAVHLAKKMLKSVDNSLKKLGKLSSTELEQFKGVGKAKATSIMTAMELGRRRRIEEVMETETISCSEDVFNLMSPLIGEQSSEEFWVIFLNNSNKILSKDRISRGGLTSTIVDPRIIFKSALDYMSTAIILCHNHPSGKMEPSQNDKVITEKLKKAGVSLEIRVLDHVIVSDTAYFSFADEGMLK